MNRNLYTKGSLVISLDYELMWGVIDLPNSKEYAKNNVSHVQDVICKMLSLFEKYQVKVTFATVGMLMCGSKKELMEVAPKIIPSYIKHELSPYGNYLDNLLDSEYSLYFSPESVDLLKESKMVEIGTHTFSHYYCWADGQTIEEFEADIKTAIKVAESRNLRVKSIVFPRNNVNEDYLSVCYKYGITSYRGNALRFFGKSKSKLQYLFRRLCRLLDTYIQITKQNTYRYDELKFVDGLPINIPASRFLRPFSPKLRWLEPIRICRIKNEITQAAKERKMYHIWWHPHNFGANLEQNLKNLEDILMHFSYCREKYGMQTYTMNELSEILIKEYGK